MNFLNLRKNAKISLAGIRKTDEIPSTWHQKWGNVAQIVSAIVALCAVIGVIIQLYLIRGNAKETSARQVYMS